MAFVMDRVVSHMAATNTTTETGQMMKNMEQVSTPFQEVHTMVPGFVIAVKAREA